jgi:isoleucyl-tRNA synthetase
VISHSFQQSSFTPFLTENIYQSLRLFIQPGALSVKDTRSIHFLPFPEVKTKLQDVVIERRIQSMKIIIDLTRALRERSSISLKVSLLSSSIP